MYYGIVQTRSAFSECMHGCGLLTAANDSLTVLFVFLNEVDRWHCCSRSIMCVGSLGARGLLRGLQGRNKGQKKTTKHTSNGVTQSTYTKWQLSPRALIVCIIDLKMFAQKWVHILWWWDSMLKSWTATSIKSVIEAHCYVSMINVDLFSFRETALHML